MSADADWDRLSAAVGRAEKTIRDLRVRLRAARAGQEELQSALAAAEARREEAHRRVSSLIERLDQLAGSEESEEGAE
ncbi:MAG: hypothetical protein ACREKN_07915 [Longimicrobiaceae bacterium]